MKVLVTGAAGFVGCNFVRHLLNHFDYRVISLDALTYAGNLENLAGLEDHPRHEFVYGNICDRALVQKLMASVDAVVHFAAESHVDRSIVDATPFVETNVVGTTSLLDACLEHSVERFVHVSTDEVYGALGPTGRCSEDAPLAPNNPYAASKAASDLLVRAYHHTHGLPVIITRSCNNYGPHQFPEKLIPLMITRAMEDESLPIYGDGTHVRDWIHVEDHVRGVVRVLQDGKAGEVYNMGGYAEHPNLEVVDAILRGLGKPHSLITHVADRPGHDFRYAMDSSKIKQTLGWEPQIAFEDGIAETIAWYDRHRDWWAHILDGSYRSREILPQVTPLRAMGS